MNRSKHSEMGSIMTTTKNSSLRDQLTGWHDHCDDTYRWYDEPEGTLNQLIRNMLRLKNIHDLHVYEIYNHYFCLPRSSRKGDEDNIFTVIDYNLLLNKEISWDYMILMELADYLDCCAGNNNVNYDISLLIKRQYVEIKELHRRHEVMTSEAIIDEVNGEDEVKKEDK